MQQKLNSMVSIIVPIYNTEKYLRECLTSIEHQTYKNFEVIMVNDGSTDTSVSICNEFSKRDGRFLLINQQNLGVCAARTHGVKKSKGQFISFIDSDDTVEKNFIESLCRKIEETGADIAQCDSDINGIKEHPQWNERFFTKEEIMRGFLNGDFFNKAPLKIYKKKVIQDIPFPEGRPIMEDAAWSAMVYEKCNSLIRIPDALYHYRMVSTSLTHRKLSENEECGKFRNLIDKALIIERNIDDAKSYELLNRYVLEFLPWILGSHDNLNLYDTYSYLQHLIEILTAHGFDNWHYALICSKKDFRSAQHEYARKILSSGNDTDLKYKLKIIARILKRR